MNPAATEAAVLENIVPELEAEGFEVYARPTAGLLPPFLQACSPDAIARREDKNLAIEILRKGSASEIKLDKLRELLSGRRDWELRVYWISPSNTPEVIRTASSKDIEQATDTIEGLSDKKLFAPALLVAWATLEALGRALLPRELERPQTPRRLVGVLAGEGYLTPSEADRLRQLAEVRNQFIHGGLKAKIAPRDIRSFTKVLRTLLELLRTAQSATRSHQEPKAD
jgi:uncharacterized protein YutE (UPF0331/DUF86 family)